MADNKQINAGPGRGGARRGMPRPKVENPGLLFKRIMDMCLNTILFTC